MARNTERLHVSTEGMECPAFVAENAFSGTPDKDIHAVELADPTAELKTGETSTVIRMVVEEDGGVVTFDDGSTICRRVIDDLEHTVDVFRDTVDETVESYNSRDVDFEFRYSSGFEPVEFETQT